MASGASGRRRVHPAELDEVEIPIPSLDEQESIVDRWRAARSRIHDYFKRAAELEETTQRELLEDLGLTVRPEKLHSKAFAVGWEHLERWGVASNLHAAAAFDLDRGKYLVFRLGDVIDDLENGWSPQCLDRPAEDEEWGVLKLGAVSFGVYDDSENKALPPRLDPIPELEVKKDKS